MMRIHPLQTAAQPQVRGIVCRHRQLVLRLQVVAGEHGEVGRQRLRGDAVTREARRHGRLRAWVRTDAEGMYRFQSIRPGSYPGRDVPEHIHMHVIEPGRFTYYIDDLVFTDDPKLTTAYIRDHDAGRGGSGIASPQRRDGVWQVRRDITLGLRIPGHPDSSLG